MVDQDILLVTTEAGLQVISTVDDGLLLVDADTQIELLTTENPFEILDVALQGVSGPPGKTGPAGVTIFTDIAATALSTINSRLAVLDQFSASLTNTTESSDFSTVYQLHI